MDSLTSTLSIFILPDLANIVADYHNLVPTDDDINNKKILNEMINDISGHIKFYLEFIKYPMASRLGINITSSELEILFINNGDMHKARKKFHAFRKLSRNKITNDFII